MNRLAVLQMCSVLDKSVNLTKTSALIELAVRRDHASFICLPENFDFIGPGDHEPINGTLVNAYKSLAKQHNVWLSLGGLHERLSEPIGDKKFANTHLIIDNEGNTRALYRKLHLFDANVDGGWTGSF